MDKIEEFLELEYIDLDEEINKNTILKNGFIDFSNRLEDIDGGTNFE
ncbi:hypothetical protein SUT503_14420 [Streptococcus parasuis]|nr:hypothetical protein SUT503_14420 [Streptococcus parasuis]